MTDDTKPADTKAETKQDTKPADTKAETASSASVELPAADNARAWPAYFYGPKKGDEKLCNGPGDVPKGWADSPKSHGHETYPVAD